MWTDVISLGEASKTQAGAYVYTHSVEGEATKYTAYTDYGGGATNISRVVDIPALDNTRYYYKIVLSGLGDYVNKKTGQILRINNSEHSFYIQNIDDYSLKNSVVGKSLKAMLQRIPKAELTVKTINIPYETTWMSDGYGHWFYFDSSAQVKLYKDTTTGKVDLHYVNIYVQLRDGSGKVATSNVGMGITSVTIGKLGYHSQNNPQLNPWNIKENADSVIFNGYARDLFFQDVGDQIKIEDNTLITRFTLGIAPNLSWSFSRAAFVMDAKFNTVPIIALNTANNQTLYENDTFKIDGTASDSDVGDILNVYYRINGGTARAIATGISTGAAIQFNEQLTFKGGVLYKGATAITGALAEGPAHRLEVWSEDNKGGKSTVAERTFYVVPNRAPSLTINPFNAQSGMINNDKIAFSGTSSDPDKNDVKVAYKLNSNAAVQIHSGPAGAWSFDLPLSALKDGENIIIVEVTDTYNFKSSKTIKLNKHANLTPLSQSVQRYKIVPPSGSAQGVLLWVERGADQVVSAEISMTTGSEQEQYAPMTLSNSAPSKDGTQIEDQFSYLAATDKENINVKFNISGTGPVTLISGVLS